MLAPTAAPPAHLVAQRRVVRDFEQAGAVSAADAIAYAPDRLVRRKAFERLCAAGIVRATGTGRYWLDLAAWKTMRTTRRKRVASLLAFGTLAVFLASRL